MGAIRRSLGFGFLSTPTTGDTLTTGDTPAPTLAWAGRFTLQCTGMDHIKFARRLLILIFGITLPIFWLEAAWDFMHAIDPATGEHVQLLHLRATPEMVRSLASSFGGAYGTMIAMLLTFISLAIPITANLYTPELINIFIRDPINLFVICTCTILASHNLLAVTLSFDEWTAQLPFAIAVAGAIFGWLLLLPYYFYVVSFIDPLTIIERSRKELEKALNLAARGKLPTIVAQQRVNQNIHNLGSVLLRAADRADRDTTLDAARIHIFEINRMRALKLDLPAAFLHVDNDVLAGMGGAAAIIVSEQKIWVEHQIAHQLVLAFKVVLSRMPDGVSAMAQMVKNAAHEQARVRNDEVFFLLVRILNSFTREAIKKRENAPVCNVIYSYRTLVRRMLVDRPELIPRLLRYLRFYADFANRQGLPFIYCRMSYELCELTEYAYDHRTPLG